MDDTISRKSAIDAADKIIERDTSGNNDVVKAMTAWKKYVKALPSAQPEQRWIPCSERLPEDGRYLCTYENAEGICVDFGRVIDGEWWVMPIAWMPLPEPYREEGGAE